jgi:hypothetical protein
VTLALAGLALRLKSGGGGLPEIIAATSERIAGSVA